MAETSPYEGVEFISDAERTYFEEARLGLQIESWVRGDVGRYIHGRAKHDYEQAKEDLLHCRTVDGADATELRIKAKIADSVMRYLVEGISNGQSAEQMLNQEQTEEIPDE